MSLERQWRMIELLLEKTENGEIDWKPTIDVNTFQVSFKNYSLLLREEESENPEERDYVVSLLNEAGEVSDSFNDVALYQAFPQGTFTEKNRPYKVMAALFGLARRRATGADKIIDAILGELEASDRQR